MLKSYKYAIFPTEKQKIYLTKIFGQVRFVYNQRFIKIQT